MLSMHRPPTSIFSTLCRLPYGEKLTRGMKLSVRICLWKRMEICLLCDQRNGDHYAWRHLQNGTALQGTGFRGKEK